uniref:Uncharacterized protein n=1 Tax=Moniliophthora roreri TaxID=221103 RepID=A0A0W0FWD5_MONRR
MISQDVQLRHLCND